MRKLRLSIGTLVLIAIANVGVAQQGGSNEPKKWVTTWGSSQVAPLQGGAAPNDQTLRLILRPTVGGEKVRIRLANTFGAKAIKIGAASIAVHDADAAVIGSTVKPLSFSGQSSIVIAPAATWVSDPVSLTVTPGKSLAVSIYFPDDSGVLSAHPGANQVSYVSTAGNFVAKSDGAPFTTEIASWPLLASVEVGASTAARSIVMFGDSITDGYKSTIGANHRWPDFFAERLRAAGKKLAIVNQGISGNRILHDSLGPQPRFGANALSRFERDVLATSGVSHVVVLIGINDIGMGSPARNPAEAVSADDIIAAYRQLIVRAHAKGLEVIGATLTPFRGAAYFYEDGEAKRQAVNKWIRSSTEWDGVIDFDLATRDPSKEDTLLPAFDSGDHLHPNDAGYKAMAEAVSLSLFE